MTAHGRRADGADRELHPVVREAERLYRRLRPEPSGFYWPRNVRGLKLRVSEAALPRALQLVDRLLKAAEAKGYVVAVGEEAGSSAHVVIAGERVGIGMREGTVRTPHVATPEELAGKEQWSWRRIPEYDHHPSGLLAFVLGAPSGEQSNWSEGKRWKLEDRISATIEGMESAARALKVQRLAFEERQRENQDRSRREAEEAERERELDQRVDQLLGHVATWRQSNEIRAFIEDVRRVANGTGHPIAPDSELGQWLAWAEQYAADIDPLREVRRRVVPCGSVTDET